MEAAPSLIDDARALVSACAWPSEAYWRLLELAAVRRWADVAHPVLELGCGDGSFTERTGIVVDLAVDRQANAVDRSRRRARTYRDVRQMDVRDLDERFGLFGTVFSNSVLEHVDDLEPVLARCRELLRPGGRFVATVPVAEMNAHLGFRSPRYVQARQRQLQHTNLWTVEEWRAKLEATGFASVAADGYLDADACRRWDRLDLLGAVGTGRYRIAPVTHRALSVALPEAVKRPIRDRIAQGLVGWTEARPGGRPCAAVLVATTPT